MNKILMFLLIGLSVLSCKTTTHVAGTHVGSDRTSQAGLKGNWQITKVLYPGSDYFKVNSFQITDSKCLIGSTWNFIPNNNKGSMSLVKSDCPAFSSPIVWSIDKTGMFGLKIVDTGVKSKTITQGYKLKVANQTETSFQLIDEITVGGQRKEITYQFEKIN